MFPPIVLKQIIVVLLTISLSSQYSYVVTAFSRSPLPFSVSTTTKLSLSSGSAADQVEVDEDIAHQELLLDESALLYSLVSRRTNFDDNTEVEIDIQTLRKNELTSLIEDTVFEARGTLAGGIIAAEAKGDDLVAEDEKEPESLDEISRALDQQILLGYQSTYTEEELTQWAGMIDSLYVKLQSQLTALPPASSSSSVVTTTHTSITTSTTVETTVTPLDQLYVRLESMRDLIDPENNSRVRLPLARPVIKVENVQSSKSVAKLVPPPLRETKTEVTTNIENDETTDDPVYNSTSLKTDEVMSNPVAEALKSNSKAMGDKVPLIPSSANSSSSNMTQTTSSTSDDSTTLHADSSNTSKKSQHFSPKYNSISPPRMSNSRKTKNLNRKSGVEYVSSGNGIIEADHSTNTTTTTTTDNMATNITTSNTSNFTIVFSDHQALPDHEKITKVEGTADVISTVITTAALGAGAVTKLPLFVAGVALGPVIRDSISYARNRMKTTSTTPDDEINSSSQEEEDCDGDKLTST